jgi:hypothetical protein
LSSLSGKIVVVQRSASEPQTSYTGPIAGGISAVIVAIVLVVILVIVIK